MKKRKLTVTQALLRVDEVGVMEKSKRKSEGGKFKFKSGSRVICPGNHLPRCPNHAEIITVEGDTYPAGFSRLLNS